MVVGECRAERTGRVGKFSVQVFDIMLVVIFSRVLPAENFPYHKQMLRSIE